MFNLVPSTVTFLQCRQIHSWTTAAICSNFVSGLDGNRPFENMPTFPIPWTPSYLKLLEV